MTTVTLVSTQPRKGKGKKKNGKGKKKAQTYQVVPKLPATVAKVQSALAKSRQPRLNFKSTFAACRLNPLSSTGMGMLLPDTNTCRRIVIDHRVQYGVSLNGACSPVLRFLPTPQYPMVVHTNTTNVTQLTLNGTVYQQATNGTSNVNSWGVGPTFPGWGQGLANNTEQAVAPFNATSFRIVSAEVKILYTGPAANAKGLVQVQPNPISIMQFASPLPGSIATFTRLDAAGVAITTGPCAHVSPLYGDLNGVTPSMTSMRPEVGTSFLLRQIEPTLPFRPITQVPNTMVESGNNTNFLVSNYGLSAWDNSWQGMDVRLFNSDANSDYLVEVCYCIEYLVAPTSDIAPLIHAPPPSNTALLDKLGSFVSHLPTAESISEAATRLERFAQFVSRGVSSAKRIGSAARSIGSVVGPMALMAI